MNKFSQSDELQGYYNDLQKWIDDGMPDNEIFFVWDSVCWNLENYCLEYPLLNWHNLDDELFEQFLQSDLDCHYPFGVEDFEALKEDRFMYNNIQRLKWIKEHSNIHEESK